MPMIQRPSLIEHFIGEIDSALRTLIPPKPRVSNRQSPASDLSDHSLSAEEKKHVAGLMRVNHSGEVCAQALYRGQALTARVPDLKHQMHQAASEEVDHLAWCEERLMELNATPSVFNPIWYLGSLMLGIAAGLAGDHINLGFLAETELQVSNHLQQHVERLPKQDEKTKRILEQMHEDECHHADMAIQAGAADLPLLIKNLMQKASKLMTLSSYYI